MKRIVLTLVLSVLALTFLSSRPVLGQTDHGGTNVTWSGQQVSGVHYNINTLTVNGTVTVTPKVSLVVTAAAINVNGVLSADFAGYVPGDTSSGQGGTGGNNTGAGGGGYGGAGGNGNTGVLGGTNWGNPDITTEKDSPNEFGSAGGTAYSCTGGKGGGAIKLAATGTLTVSGEITADGQNGQTEADDGSGGGAGGSIWLDCNTLAGGGFVTAFGGEGQDVAGKGGGGGGGRISVYCNINNSGIFYDVSGGFGPGAATDGGSGTLRINGADGPPPASNFWDHVGYDWIVGSDQVIGYVHTNVNNFIVTNCTATVESGVKLKVYATNIIIAGNGVLNANGAGAASMLGTGVGNDTGGGYGGAGGDSSYLAPGGWAWGNPSATNEMCYPDELGSSAFGGGAGGGAVRLVGSNNLKIDGSITANGNDGGGGGSGGSIWLDCVTMTGTGVVKAAGGNGGSGCGGGGGGRIAIYCYTNSSSVNLGSSAVARGSGSGGGENGQYGTVWLNDHLVFTNSWMDQDHGGANWIISADTMSIGGTHTGVGTFQVNSNVTAAVVRGTKLNVSAIKINIFGTLMADGRGYSSGAGSPGDGAIGYDNGPGGGGGYGGEGGTSPVRAGGPAWGNPSITNEILHPDEWGSAGGYAYAAGYGGSGGGAIKLKSYSTMIINGVISANGRDGGNAGDDGNAGGAGGSIWVDSFRLQGTGTVSAAGGDAQNRSGAAGGGGGRISIYYFGEMNLTTNVTAGADFSGVKTAAVVGTCNIVVVPMVGTVITVR